MISLDLEWQTNEFMLYCRTTQLREKSMMAYEQSLKLFERWCRDEMGIFTVDKMLSVNPFLQFSSHTYQKSPPYPKGYGGDFSLHPDYLFCVMILLLFHPAEVGTHFICQAG